MPLYMDIHTVNTDEFSAEDVVKAHMEDLAVQDRYGVKQLKYWVNEQAKTIFCLMQGPDKESCNQVHLESHGNTACNIIEVSDDEYQLFMGQGTDVNDLATTDSGELDSGYRSIILINCVRFGQENSSLPDHIKTIIHENNGTIVREPSEQIMASFVFANESISCANAIKELLDGEAINVEFNLAIVSGRPVDEVGEDFFEETKLKLDGLCALGLNRRLYLDKETLALSDKEINESAVQRKNFTVLDRDALLFSMKLSQVVNQNLTKSDFATEDLFKALGMSKSRANRKIKSLTDMSPNQLIQESRLLKSVQAIIKTNKTIAEIAYDSGFNSPTYFTRVFKKRFEIAPTDFAKQFI